MDTKDPDCATLRYHKLTLTAAVWPGVLLPSPRNRFSRWLTRKTGAGWDGSGNDLGCSLTLQFVGHILEITQLSPKEVDLLHRLAEMRSDHRLPNLVAFFGEVPQPPTKACTAPLYSTLGRIWYDDAVLLQIASNHWWRVLIDFSTLDVRNLETYE
jgi:hypothetical protein